jgi:hypothetical protein
MNSSVYPPGAVHSLNYDAAVGMVTMTVLGVAINAVLSRTVAVGAPRVEGCTRWSWYMGLFTQSLVYPLICFLAWRSKGFETTPWLNAKWTDYGGDFYFERLWFYAFFGYLMKDMADMTDALYIVHHVACMVGVIMTLFLPCGFVPLLLGMCSLEMGSACMCLAKIMPEVPHTNPKLDLVYWAGMTFSNLFCLACCGYNAFFVDFGMLQPFQWYMKLLFVLITSILCYLRQEAAVDNYKESEERYSKEKARKAK